MPRVPTLDNFQTGVGAMPVPQIGTQAGEIGARQAQEFGAALGGLADTGRKIALDMQQQVDETRVNDAINQLRETTNRLTYDPQGGYLNLKGKDALERPDGMALPDEYAGKLREQATQIASTLGNDQQRRLFQTRAGALTTAFSGDVQQHMLKEWTGYSLSVQDGTIKLAMDDAERAWQDPTKVQASLDAAKAAVYQKGKLSGWAAAQTDAVTAQTVSGVHTRVVLSALENGNPAYAQSYLARFKESMTADDVLKVQGQVNQQVWAGMAQAAVTQATQATRAAVQPNDFDRLVGITLAAESGGRRFGADGGILTSPKGAKGEMQVLDSTAAAPGFGVRPARTLADGSIDPDDRARVGREYLGALVQKYGGDAAKAWAAYNAGPGAVDKALAEAEKDIKTGAFRGPAPADLWLQKLPAETQAYVRNNAAKLEAGGGAPPRLTEDQFVQQALAALPPGLPPSVTKMTRDAAVQQFGILEKSRKDLEEQGTADAMRWLAQNGGRFSDLPPSLRGRIPPDKIDDVMNFGQRVFKGDDSTDPAVYQRLSDPQYLRGLSEDQFFQMRRVLSQSDFQHFANERAALRNPKAGMEPGNADTAAIKTATDEQLRALRIDPSPKDDGGADAARVGAVRKYVTDEVLRAQALAGKKFTDAEVRQHVGRLFAQSDVVSGWFSASKAPMLTMKAGDIPSPVRDRLAADFKKLGVSDPTDAQILGAYWTLKSRARDYAPR